MKYLVTGATGAFGARAIETLSKKVGVGDIAASVRDKSKAKKLIDMGIDVRQADFNDPRSLDEAFSGIDRVLMVSTNEPIDEKRIKQHTNAINAAKKNGAKLLVYTSGTNNPERPAPLAVAHIATEEILTESGIPYCILRNNSYLETEISTIKACMSGAPLVTSAGSGKVGFAPRSDYADAAVSALIGNGNENKVYELSGKPVSYDEFANVLGKTLGKEIPVKHVDDKTYADILRRTGVPDIMIDMLAGTKKSIREGDMEVCSGDLERLLGRPATSLADGLSRLVKFLRQDLS